MSELFYSARERGVCLGWRNSAHKVDVGQIVHVKLEGRVSWQDFYFCPACYAEFHESPRDFTCTIIGPDDREAE